MLLLIGGDSELGAAAYRSLKKEGYAVEATTRRRENVSADRPYFDVLSSLDTWNPPPEAEAACIFLAVARLRDCATDPAAAALVNVSQSLKLIDKLIARGIYVLYLSSNQVFDGERANVPADAMLCPVSEYGRQKAETETAIHERMASGAPVAILRLSKVLGPDSPLIEDWISSLVRHEPIQTFTDMSVAPVPLELASTAISKLLKKKLPGIYQLTGPYDVSYADVGHYLARELGVDPDLVRPVSAASLGMPKGATPRHTTLDSDALCSKFEIVVPDVWKTLSSFLKANRVQAAHDQFSDPKLIEMKDLLQVADGVYYSSYPMPLVDAEIIAFLKQAAARSPRRRARFCAHLSPDAKQHDMLIVSHRDTYVVPHRHMSKSETFVILEGSAEIIFFGEQGEVEKTVKMGSPSSGRPFFYRMPPRQFHSLSIDSELLVFLESTTGPFDLGDREHANWAPDHKDPEGGKTFIGSIVQKAVRV